LPISTSDLESCSHHWTINQAINHHALGRRPLRSYRDVPQNTKGNGTDNRVRLDMIEHAGAPVCDSHPAFAALDLLYGTSVADRVAKLRRECSRELVIASLDL